jgi:ISXO2-like transposase domain
VTAKTLRPIMDEQIAGATRTMSDDGGARARHGSPDHHSVNHSIGEYVRGDIHTNTIEGNFSIMKRGITGVYHHVSPRHLKRYLAEYDFRYNERSALTVTDAERATKAVQGVVGKRMTYQQTNGGPDSLPV